MSHKAQVEFCKSVKVLFPESFKGKNVFDGGSLDINGNNRFLFEDCNYLGCDIGEGENVDVVSLISEYEGLNESFDTIISTECFEHDMHYQESLQNIVRMLKPKGLFLFTCATIGRREHGTRRTNTSKSAPLLSDVSEDWGNYYKNLDESMIREAIEIDEIFSSYQFLVNNSPHDLYFWGVKK